MSLCKAKQSGEGEKKTERNKLKTIVIIVKHVNKYTLDIDTYILFQHPIDSFSFAIAVFPSQCRQLVNCVTKKSSLDFLKWDLSTIQFINKLNGKTQIQLIAITANRSLLH